MREREKERVREREARKSEKGGRERIGDERYWRSVWRGALTRIKPCCMRMSETREETSESVCAFL